MKKCAAKACALIFAGLLVLVAGCIERPMGPPVPYDEEAVEQIRKDISDFEY